VGLTIGVDVGGTKVAAGVVDEEGRVLARSRRDTPSQDPEAVEDVIAEVVGELRQSYDVSAVGLGAAGFVDAERATVLFAPNLAWRAEPLRDDVQKRIGLPVVVENDANAAGWGEARFGAGRGIPTLIVVTVGTGIGGGLVIDGSLYRGRYGLAAEFGHMRVVPDGLRCGCGNKGCWEQYASGTALVREARDLAVVGSPLAARMLELASGDPAAISGPLVTRAAMEGDPVAVELFEEVGGWLGAGLANLAAVFDPEVFVIGGGVSEAGDLLLEPARGAYHLRLTGRGHRPEAEIRPAALGNDAGLIGAAYLARHS
jgi:glucokinase